MTSELRDLEQERQMELRKASLQANPRDNMARVNDDYAAKKQAIVDRYRPIAQRYVAELKSAAAELDQLNERRKQLLADAPASE